MEHMFRLSKARDGNSSLWSCWKVHCLFLQKQKKKKKKEKKICMFPKPDCVIISKLVWQGGELFQHSPLTSGNSPISSHLQTHGYYALLNKILSDTFTKHSDADEKASIEKKTKHCHENCLEHCFRWVNSSFGIPGYWSLAQCFCKIYF